MPDVLCLKMLALPLLCVITVWCFCFIAMAASRWNAWLDWLDIKERNDA